MDDIYDTVATDSDDVVQDILDRDIVKSIDRELAKMKNPSNFTEAPKLPRCPINVEDIYEPPSTDVDEGMRDILDRDIVKSIDRELEKIKNPSKSLTWRDVIEDDLKEMERDLEKIKLPRSVKSKLATTSSDARNNNEDLKGLDKEIEEVRRQTRYTRPKVFSDLSDDELDKEIEDVRRPRSIRPTFAQKTEISVDDELKALDKEIEELKKPRSYRPKVTLQQYDDDSEKNYDKEGREQSPFRVTRPVAPNYKLLIDSDEEGDIDTKLAKKFQEPADKKPGDTYKCRFCGLIYNYLTTLKAHERVHDVDEPYVCARCNLSFRYYSELQTHSIEHAGEKGYKCDCGRTFSKYTDLLYHKHPGEDDEPDEQNYMGDDISAAKIPNYVKNYPAHRISYYCQFCCKGYETSHELKYHLYSHRGERQFAIGSSASRYMMNRI